MIDILEATEQLCLVNSETGAKCLHEIASICSQYLPEDTTSHVLPSASPGASGDLYFQRSGKGKKRLLLLGHYDTVPCPIFTHRDGDILLAPGSYDMKGGIAIALALMSSFQEHDFFEAGLYLAGDEEWRRNPLKIKGTWDAVLAFEGGEKEGVVVSRFGAGVLTIKTLSENIRATYPPDGLSSISALAKLVILLEKANQKEVHFTPSRLEALSPINVIPKKSKVEGVLRYQSESKRDNFLADLPEIAKNIPVKYSFQELIPSMPSKEGSEAVVRSSGLKPLERTGSSDISFLKTQSPVLIDGLGPLGGKEHSDDEFIVVSSLEEQFAIAQKIIATTPCFNSKAK